MKKRGRRMAKVVGESILWWIEVRVELIGRLNLGI
jgi:hypothetical protein